MNLNYLHFWLAFYVLGVWHVSFILSFIWYTDVINEMKDLHNQARKMNTDQINIYLNVWYKDTAAEDLKRTLEEMEKSLWMNMDFQATQPFLQELCERNKPYKGVQQVCEAP